jgi:hypothetical protein
VEESEEEAKALRQCVVRIRTSGDNAVVYLLAETPADADRWIRLLRSWRHFFTLDAFADDRPIGLTADQGTSNGGDDDCVDPLSFVQAGPQLLAARAARAAAAQEAQAKSSNAVKDEEAEEEKVNPEAEEQPQLQSPPPARPRLPGLLWRSAGVSSEEAAVTSPVSPRAEGLGSTQSETRSGGRESPRSGATGWLSPRRLVEALSFRSLSPNGGSNLRRAESARTERD